MFESVNTHTHTHDGQQRGYQPTSSPCEPSGDLKTSFCNLKKTSLLQPLKSQHVVKACLCFVIYVLDTLDQ